MIFKAILLLVFAILAIQSNVAAQNLSVFGLKLGSPFIYKECPVSVVENKYLGGKKYWTLEYGRQAPVGEPCYKRINLENNHITKKAEIPPLPLPAPTGFVTVVSPPDALPALAAAGEYWAFVLTNGTVDGVMFKFNRNSADEVYQTLRQKYGDSAKITPMKWQNSNGASVDYYLANWDLGKITVKFQSAGLSYRPDYRDGFDMMAARESDSPFSSPYGMVTISQKAIEKPKAPKVAL